MLGLIARRHGKAAILRPTSAVTSDSWRYFSSAESKKRKVKMALVTGYTGTGYHGVQIQEDKDVPTIEHDVREALFKAGCILESNYGDMSKIGWSRSSRTDKGVHATSIVLSGKLLVHDEDIDEVTGRIHTLPDQVNAFLPPTIRIFTATKVHQSFRAREDCALREYDYFLPLSFVQKVCPDVPLDQAVNKILETLPRFEGIHDFHNFTKHRRHFYQLEARKERRRNPPQVNEEDEVAEDDGDDNEEEDDQTDDISIQNGYRKVLQRHRRTIYHCKGTVVDDLFGQSYIRIHLTGASFLLNQIRCMIGAVLGVASGALPLDLFDAALHTTRVIRVPTAPAEGLILSHCSFSTKQHLISLVVDHNTPRNLYGKLKPNQAPHRVLLTDDELDRVLAFRNEVIYKEVDRSWKESENVKKWPEGFQMWKASVADLDADSIRKDLQAYLTNEQEKAAASARVVQEARQAKDEVKVLPRAFSTTVCIRFGLTPGVFVTDVIQGLKKCVLQGRMPADATQDDLLEFMDNIGLDRLAKLGKKKA